MTDEIRQFVLDSLRAGMTVGEFCLVVAPRIQPASAL